MLSKGGVKDTMIDFVIGNVFLLRLRTTSFTDFFFNWDLDLGPLGLSYCYCRPHRLLVSWKKIVRDGKHPLRFALNRRVWKFGATSAWNGEETASGPIWKYAHKTEGRGEPIRHFWTLASAKIVLVPVRFRITQMRVALWWFNLKHNQ